MAKSANDVDELSAISEDSSSSETRKRRGGTEKARKVSKAARKWTDEETSCPCLLSTNRLK